MLNCVKRRVYNIWKYLILILIGFYTTKKKILLRRTFDDNYKKTILVG